MEIKFKMNPLYMFDQYNVTIEMEKDIHKKCCWKYYFKINTYSKNRVKRK